MTSSTLNSFVLNEIQKISSTHNIDPTILESFANFVIGNHKKKDVTKSRPSKPKSLTLNQIKEAVYKHFNVKDTTQLKRSGAFRMATDGMDDLNLSKKNSWEKLYRKFIDVLPNELNQEGYGCINGINIFEYFKPWQVFNIDPQTSTEEDIKKAYRDLSKIYHPDVPQTGDPKIFDRINSMYKSLIATA